MHKRGPRGHGPWQRRKGRPGFVGYQGFKERGAANMEAPEVEFLLYLLTRYIRNNNIDPTKVSVAELMENINVNLTPIGGG
ncbi:MAG: hypothetical protein ACUVT4_07685 [Actinomycetota bacterium]